MTTKMFTVYDCQSEAYLKPFYAHATGEAKRQFADACNDKTHPFGQHPSDYTLYEIGSFDEHSGNVSMLDAKVSLGEGITYVTGA